MRTLLLISLCAALAGCAKHLPEPQAILVDSVAEAGETHFSLLSVEPWMTAKAALNVKFDLTAAQALGEAIPRTSDYEERLLDIFSANLKAGLPCRSVNETASADAEGVSTNTRTVTRSDGTLPDDDAVPKPQNPDVKTLPGLNDNQRGGVLGQNDPLLKYQTARTVHQYVTVLDRVIDHSPQIDSYIPYLVTLQLTSFPYAKHQPYDIYVDLSFFPKNNHEGINPPLIYPVLITDNLEGQSVSRAAELVRQIGLAADVLSSGFAGSLGLSSFNARAGSVFGTDLTSTFTVGKSSENSVSVVLGAARNPISDYAMIRRTHNISVLMMLPKKILESTGRDRAVDLITTTELRRPDRKGAPLQLRTQKDDLMATAIALTRERRIDSDLDDEVLKALILTAWNAVIGGRYRKFARDMSERKYPYPQALYHTVSDLLGKSPNFRTTTIPLPKPFSPPKPTPFCIEPQTASAFDNPNNGEMRLVLTGAKGKLPRDLTATLTLSQGGIRFPFVASKVDLTGSKLVMVFPSAAGSGVDKVATALGSITLDTAAKTCPQFASSRTNRAVYAVAPKSGTKKQAATSKPAVATVSATGNGDLSIAMTAATSK